MSFSPLIRILIAPVMVALVNVLILLVVALALFDLAEAMYNHGHLSEAMEVTTGVGVILIGWGVALEERRSLRELFHLVGGPDEPRQDAIDHDCHGVGVGTLLLGLFAEVAIECIKLPDRIINTAGVEPTVLAIALLLLSISGIILLLHIFRLIRLAAARGRYALSPSPTHLH